MINYFFQRRTLAEPGLKHLYLGGTFMFLFPDDSSKLLNIYLKYGARYLHEGDEKSAKQCYQKARSIKSNINLPKSL